MQLVGSIRPTNSGRCPKIFMAAASILSIGGSELRNLRLLPCRSLLCQRQRQSHLLYTPTWLRKGWIWDLQKGYYTRPSLTKSESGEPIVKVEESKLRESTNEMACNEAEVGLTPTTLTRPKDPTIQRSWICLTHIITWHLWSILGSTANQNHMSYRFDNLVYMFDNLGLTNLWPSYDLSIHAP